MLHGRKPPRVEQSLPPGGVPEVRIVAVEYEQFTAPRADADLSAGKAFDDHPVLVDLVGIAFALRRRMDIPSPRSRVVTHLRFVEDDAVAWFEAAVHMCIVLRCGEKSPVNSSSSGGNAAIFARDASLSRIRTKVSAAGIARFRAVADDQRLVLAA